MNIGKKIKELRKQMGITQEQLAESIGVSFQAVSKWENNIALPDITLVPVIANYFRVSMDELFDFSVEKAEKETEEIVKQAQNYIESDPIQYRRIIEEGLKKYPENPLLLRSLLYVINYSDNPDETISVAERITDKTSRNDLRYDALRFLAYAYKAKGDLDSAKASIDQIPEIYFNKLTEMAYLLSGDEKFSAAEKQKLVSFENLIQMMWKIAEYYEESREYHKAIKEAQKALKLIEIIEHRQFESYKDFFRKKIDMFYGYIN